MKAIVNATIVMPDHLIPNATLVTNGDRIIDFGRKINIDGMEIFDAEGAYLGPGLIDVHTHSDGEVFFSDAPIKAANTLLAHGITVICYKSRAGSCYKDILCSGLGSETL